MTLEEALNLIALFIGLATLGAVCGYLGGLMRAGGGALLAPALWIVFAGFGLSDPAATAIGSALAIQALLSARALAARGGWSAADPALAKAWIAPAALGALLAAPALFLLPERGRLGLLGAALFVLGLRQIFAQKARNAPPPAAAPGGLRGALLLGAAAFAATLTGQGAGALGPLALSALGARSEGAAARAALAAAGLVWTGIGAAALLLAGWIAAPGLSGDFSLGWLNLAALAAATPLWIAAAPFGADLAGRLGAGMIRTGAALALTALGLVLFRQAAIG